ncbi:MAG: alginate export family protein [Planctomycetota bacterium]
MLAGRTPVCWSLLDDRTGKKAVSNIASNFERGAFLYDSRANDPVIRAWDGAMATWGGWKDMLVHPWAYRLPDASSLWGITFDWTPETARGSDRVFISGMYSEERKIILADGSMAPKLKTFAGGMDWRIDEVGLWVQGAGQRGDAGNGRSFSGLGAEAGLNWQFSPHGKGRFQLIADWLSGDDGSDPTTYRGFINKWESISDTFIVENEKYGELSKLVVGNLHAIKARWGIGLSETDDVRFDFTAAHYRLDRELAGGGGREFGSEIDMQLRWQYSYYAQVRFFGGVFKPGGAMTTAQEARAAALGSPITADRDPIWLTGMNLYVDF